MIIVMLFTIQGNRTPFLLKWKIILPIVIIKKGGNNLQTSKIGIQLKKSYDFKS